MQINEKKELLLEHLKSNEWKNSIRKIDKIDVLKHL